MSATTEVRTKTPGEMAYGVYDNLTRFKNKKTDHWLAGFPVLDKTQMTAYLMFCKLAGIDPTVSPNSPQDIVKAEKFGIDVVRLSTFVDEVTEDDHPYINLINITLHSQFDNENENGSSVPVKPVHERVSSILLAYELYRSECPTIGQV